MEKVDNKIKPEFKTKLKIYKTSFLCHSQVVAQTFNEKTIIWSEFLWSIFSFCFVPKIRNQIFFPFFFSFKKQMIHRLFTLVCRFCMDFSNVLGGALWWLHRRATARLARLYERILAGMLSSAGKTAITQQKIGLLEWQGILLKCEATNQSYGAACKFESYALNQEFTVGQY